MPLWHRRTNDKPSLLPFDGWRAAADGSPASPTYEGGKTPPDVQESQAARAAKLD